MQFIEHEKDMQESDDQDGERCPATKNDDETEN